MGTVDLPFLNSFKDRYGVMRYYYRRDGKNVPLRPERVAHDYVKVHDEFENGGGQAMTISNLTDAYFKSAEFLQLRPSTQAQYRWHLTKARQALGEILVSDFGRRVVLEHRDTLRANRVARIRVLKTLMSFALQRELIETNPLFGLRGLKLEGEGWSPWSARAIKIFKEKSVGSPRMAFYLALYTSQRRGDVLKMRWDDVQEGTIRLKQGKTGAVLEIPIHPDLQAELDKHQGDKSPERCLVCRQDGNPYTPAGFKRVWEEAQKRLGLSGGHPFHGIRKNAIQLLFEAGCTPQEVMAISGHTTLQMVAHYGKKAAQRRMAESAMDKFVKMGGGS